MASTFAFQGSYTANPISGSPSADPQITAPINEMMTLVNESVSQLTLNTDGIVSLPMCAVDSVNVLVLKCVGGKITVLLTSSDGASQKIPVDSFLALTTANTDITSISVERTPSVQTVVKYFLGQKA